MDGIKKQRKILRMAFTKTLNAFNLKMDSDCSKEEKIMTFQLLEMKMSELDIVHAEYNKSLFETDMQEANIFNEMETDDSYKTQYLAAKMKIEMLMMPISERTVVATSKNGTNTTKYPKLELPKFCGNIKDWLPFWSQFKKVDEDTNICKEDKMRYLLQAMVPDSRAYDVVQSFPPTGENYVKAVSCLKTRFGKDDLIVEFYVRKLLSLVLQNAVKGNKRLTLANIYDKIECNIRALEFLGVTTDKCAAMLYPLVESSLPEEILRAWQRSGQRETKEGDIRQGGNGGNDRLTKLLEFLQYEVENQQRIDMALTGFSISSEQDKIRKTRGSSEMKEVASVLLVSKDKKKPDCIFCKSDHSVQDCDVARKLTLEERKEVVKRERCCFTCLKKGHISQKCRVNIKCDWCSKRHLLLMCPEISGKDKVEINKPVEKTKIVNDQHNLVTFCETYDVCTLTLRVMVFSPMKEKLVRAIIDTASQRSYIRTDIAKELGYISLGELQVKHTLFGGIKTENKIHNMYKIYVKSLDDRYSCNFTAMGQDVICGSIMSVSKDSLLDELKVKNIQLSDIEGKSTMIDILIGADIAGKLLTGNKLELSNGLTAFETNLGWSVSGKLLKKQNRNDTVMSITTMLVQEANPSDL